MKTKRQLLLILIFVGIIFALILYGCKKDDNPVTPQSPLSETDAANLIAASLGGSASTNGISSQIEEAATVAGGGGLGKRSDSQSSLIPGFDTTIVKSDTIGLYSYHYTFHYSYSFSNFGNRLDFLYTMKGVYDTPRVSSDDSANASLVITHIVDADTQYTLNETYLRLGSQSSKVGDKVQFTSTISIMLANIKVSKSTKKIQSGTGTISVSGQTNDGRSFSFTATILFVGNQQAILSVNSRSFNVNLVTGTATELSPD